MLRSHSELYLEKILNKCFKVTFLFYWTKLYKFGENLTETIVSFCSGKFSDFASFFLVVVVWFSILAPKFENYVPRSIQIYLGLFLISWAVSFELRSFANCLIKRQFIRHLIGRLSHIENMNVKKNYYVSIKMKIIYGEQPALPREASERVTYN